MIQEIADALVQSWRNFATAFVLFVPRLVAATIIFAGGFVVALAGAPGRPAAAGVAALRSPGAAHRARARCCASPRCRAPSCWSRRSSSGSSGLASSSRPSIRCSSGRFRGWSSEFFRFVPRFLVALLVLALGFLVGNFLWRATLLASVNAGLPGARLLSGTLRLLVIAIAVVMALEQLGLATTVVLTAFAIAFGALMLGLAIAFGLGGRDAAQAAARAALQGARRDARDGRRTHL